MSEKDRDMDKELFAGAVEIPQYNIKITQPGNKAQQTKDSITSLENFYRTIFKNTGTATVILKKMTPYCW